jgi:hypothetical protein
MDADKKAKIARTLGFICLGVGLLNMTLAVVAMGSGRTQSGTPLLATAVGAFTIGIFLVTRGKGKATPGV